ncbi:MAG: flagellar motor protein MotD [Nitrosomonadales bacterium]|nr:flagellar motor protein MotD [Nitrosomonadales bacterium]
MSRRKKFEIERENHDRWLVSYADFITLLFAFFVVMYAVSAVNQNKYKQLANSLGSAFGSSKVEKKEQLEGGQPGSSEELAPESGVRIEGSFIKPFAAVQSRNDKWRREREAMTTMALDISQALSPMIEQGTVRVLQNNRGIRIDIESSVLFALGSAELEISALQPLLEVARLLAEKPNAIQVEGHTDNVPIRNYLFYSNWELSAVRASSVVRLLVQNGIAEERLSAVGYGSAQPFDTNDTAEGRANNRRVSIMVLYAAPEKANDGAEIKTKP